MLSVKRYKMNINIRLQAQQLIDHRTVQYLLDACMRWLPHDNLGHVALLRHLGQSMRNAATLSTNNLRAQIFSK
jgi:hypothetical protein